MNKVYHIYVKGKCEYHSLSEEDFAIIWRDLRNLSWISGFNDVDLDYEELITNPEVSQNSSH